MERFEKAMRAHATVTAVCIDELETEEIVSERINDLLSTFAVDVVVIAPACSDIGKSIALPPAWDGISIEEVVLEAKPVTALATVWTQSWLTRQWHFPMDGAPS